MNDLELADRLIGYYQSPNHPDQAAWDAAAALLTRNPDQLLRVLLLAATRTTNEDVLEALGEGHLEDLLAECPGTVDAILDAARREPGIATALRCAWNPRFAPAVAAKIDAFFAERDAAES